MNGDHRDHINDFLDNDDSTKRIDDTLIEKTTLEGNYLSENRTKEPVRSPSVQNIGNEKRALHDCNVRRVQEHQRPCGSQSICEPSAMASTPSCSHAYTGVRVRRKYARRYYDPMSDHTKRRTIRPPRQDDPHLSNHTDIPRSSSSSENNHYYCIQESTDDYDSSSERPRKSFYTRRKNRLDVGSTNRVPRRREVPIKEEYNLEKEDKIELTEPMTERITSAHSDTASSVGPTFDCSNLSPTAIDSDTLTKFTEYTREMRKDLKRKYKDLSILMRDFNEVVTKRSGRALSTDIVDEEGPNLDNKKCTIM